MFFKSKESWNNLEALLKESSNRLQGLLEELKEKQSKESKQDHLVLNENIIRLNNSLSEHAKNQLAQFQELGKQLSRLMTTCEHITQKITPPASGTPAKVFPPTKLERDFPDLIVWLRSLKVADRKLLKLSVHDENILKMSFGLWGSPREHYAKVAKYIGKSSATLDYHRKRILARLSKIKEKNAFLS